MRGGPKSSPPRSPACGGVERPLGPILHRVGPFRLGGAITKQHGLWPITERALVFGCGGRSYSSRCVHRSRGVRAGADHGEVVRPLSISESGASPGSARATTPSSLSRRCSFSSQPFEQRTWAPLRGASSSLQQPPERPPSMTSLTGRRRCPHVVTCGVDPMVWGTGGPAIGPSALVMIRRRGSPTCLARTGTPPANWVGTCGAGGN